LRRVAAQFFWTFGQHDNRDFLSSLMQLARGHKAVAAVVAPAADRADRVEIEVLLRELGHGRPGVFHQRERGDAILFSGRAVDGAHLVSGDDLHERREAALAARLSSLASCAGSPMAMSVSPAWIGSGASGLKRVSPEAWRMARIMMPNW